MGGTTEHAGNFVPVDERLVSFFVSLKKEKGRNYMSNIVQQDILQQLQQLQKDAQTALAQANTTEATRQWYSEIGRAHA